MLPLLAAALACGECHHDLVTRFARTPMANSSGPVRPEAETPGVTGPFSISPAMRLTWPGGAVDLTFFIGSKRMGRSYAHEWKGHLYQVPVGFYGNRASWDPAPGYERDANPDLGRPITAECLFCHATRAAPEPGTLNRYTAIDHGIGCARCHGDSPDHERLLNPAKLSPRPRDSVCEQCHLAGTVRLARAGRKLTGFRPGQDLADFVEVAVGASKPGVRVNGHAEALAESACKKASGAKLWCGTCHSPHREPSYEATCKGCHSKPHVAEGCVGCHMPKARAADGGHTVFTDHSISLRKRTASPLRSYFGRALSDRDAGLIHVELAAKNHDTALLEKAWPLLRRAVAARGADPPLLNAVGGLLQADGRRDQAAEYWRLSLRHDPVQPELMVRLAALAGDPAEAARLRSAAEKMLPTPSFSK